MFQEAIEQRLSQAEQADQCNQRVQADWQVLQEPDRVSVFFNVTPSTAQDTLTSVTVSFALRSPDGVIQEHFAGFTAGPTSGGVASHGLQGNFGAVRRALPKDPDGELVAVLAGTVTQPGQAGCTFLFIRPLKGSS